jgi:hypothetical protein
MSHTIPHHDNRCNNKIGRTALKLQPVAQPESTPLPRVQERECPRCYYALFPNTGRCSNFECPHYHRPPGAMTVEQIIGEYAPPPLFHGRRWGSWTLDTERVCLVYDAEPVTLGEGADRYVAFLGGYEVDVEVIRQSSQVLDWIFQIRSWATARVMKDLIEALDDILRPQANLCSGGGNKVIQNPKAFLKHRIATVGILKDAA